VHPVLRSVADRRLGVFTGREARAAGYGYDEIRALVGRREWTRLRRGVYIETRRALVLRAEPRTSHLLDCVAVLVALGPGPVLSHGSAAWLHDLPVPRDLGGLIRLTDEAQWRTGRGYRVARASVPRSHTGRFLRFRATNPARTLVDCAREWAVEDAVIALDAALQTKKVTRSALVGAVLDARHWVGVGAAARALGLSDGRAESPLETRGRLAMLSAGLPLPELQVELHDERGFIGRVDAWYEDAAVAIEFDGRIKYTQPRDNRTPAQVAWEEKRREDRIRALDVRFVRIVDEDLGAAWRGVADRVRRLRATPFVGTRRFRVVRRPEPGSAAA
jgi:hypothetical protein